jgi:chemotaxis protein CheD
MDADWPASCSVSTTVSTMLLEMRDDTASPPDSAEWGPAVPLQAGDLHIGLRPCTLTTVVGSCVTVCIHDPAARVGGANHYLLPYNLNSGEALRYGAVSIPRLVNELLKGGARRCRLEAKVFGGACMLAALRVRPDHLGHQNVRLAERLLAENGIPIVAQDTEGDRARRVFFRTDNGAVWVKKL